MIGWEPTIKKSTPVKFLEDNSLNQRQVEFEVSLKLVGSIDILQNALESETLVPNMTRLKPSVPSFARTLIKLNLQI